MGANHFGLGCRQRRYNYAFPLPHIYSTGRSSSRQTGPDKCGTRSTLRHLNRSSDATFTWPVAAPLCINSSFLLGREVGYYTWSTIQVIIVDGEKEKMEGVSRFGNKGFGSLSTLGHREMYSNRMY